MTDVVEVLIPGLQGPPGPAGASTAEAAASAAAAAASATAADASADASAASAASAAAVSAPILRTTSYTVVSADAGKPIILNGAAMGTITFTAATGYSTTGHRNLILNRSSRRWSVAISGGETKWLWPGQALNVHRNDTVWAYDDPGLWMGQNGLNAAGAGNAVLFVSASAGNDANDGLVAGAGGALNKIQTAIDIAQYNFGIGCSIQLAVGTNSPRGAETDVALYSGASHGKPSNIIAIFGDLVAGGPSRTSYIITCPGPGTCVNAQDHATLIVQGVYFQTTGAGATAVSARQLAIVDIIDCDVGAFPSGFHISCTNQASIGILAGGANPSINIRGGAAGHISCSLCAYINYGGSTVNLVGTPAFTIFATAAQGGQIGGGPMTFTGTGATGQRYNVSLNAVISSGGMIFPGSTAGATSTGGQYV